jgi:putative LysE/RhtB family amino acid efflux pump
MSTVLLFLKSIVIGIAIAAPIGPIGMLCIKNTVKLGATAGLAVGLGAALADALYGIIAGLGLDLITKSLLNHLVYIKVAGGLFLLYLAYKEYKSENVTYSKSTIENKELWQITWISFLLTLANPMTIMSFLGVFSALIGESFNLLQAVVMVIGIFIGSLIWWKILVELIKYSKNFLPVAAYVAIKNFSALILCGFGLFTLLSTIKI